MQYVSSYLTPFLSLYAHYLQLKQVVQCHVTLCGILSVDGERIFEDVLVLLLMFLWGNIHFLFNLR
jgi:hypothetical protein